MLLSVVSRYSAVVLAIIALSYSLPAGFEKVFSHEVGNPLLFYSPLEKQFIYRESLGSHQFNYLSEENTRFDRAGFEKLLPFLYYKNFEKRNMLPIVIDGQSFDVKAIKAEKQGLDIRSRHLLGHHPQIELYPLFNNDPNVAIMPFPEDVFRITDRAMEFVNADFNKVDDSLTQLFTSALQEQGFVFPATVIGGKTTNLKPFDEGFFVCDNMGQVFHIKRVLNEPVVVRTPIDTSLDIQDIIISENRRKEFYGTIITRQGGLYLISYDNYRLIKLPVKNYHPETMDFKMLITPLSRTAVVSDSGSVHGTAMDGSYRILREYSLERRDSDSKVLRIVHDALFPFQLSLDSPYRGQADLQLQIGSAWSLVGIFVALMLYFLLKRKREERSFSVGESGFVLVSGFFGLLAVFFIGRD